MTSISWDYWNKDNTPKELTTLARAALESTIKKYPRHPGAHHLYIHLVEASDKPGDAYKSAEFLETAMPGAGHIVHMPSHIFLRLGGYERSNNSNQEAIKADEESLARADDPGIYSGGYFSHNIDFLIYGAMMNGRSATALGESKKLADLLKKIETKMPLYNDAYSSMAVIAMVRYGKWNDILALPLPDDSRTYQTSTMLHFARGTAFLRGADMKKAKRELSKLDSISRLDTLKSIYGFFASAEQLAKIATNILQGEILIKERKIEDGLLALASAVTTEGGLRYDEPPDWRIPTRHYLGAALYEAGRYEEAIKVYEQDLARNPENGWSLRGLANCQQKTGKKAEAAVTIKRLERAWNNADIAITSSRF